MRILTTTTTTPPPLALGLLLCGAVTTGAVEPALARAPAPEVVAEATARVQQRARRSAPTQFRVTVWALPRAPASDGAADDTAHAVNTFERTAAEMTRVARGRLRVTPEGRARLEVEWRDGGIERQLRRGAQFGAAKNGVRLTRPLPVLPPLWLLQTIRAELLLEQLAALGGDPTRLQLGYDGDHDFFVLGGRSGGAALWIDREDFVLRRITLAPGLHYRFGPVAEGGVWPAWFEVEAPGLRALRVELESPEAAAPGAWNFDPGWLAN